VAQGTVTSLGLSGSGLFNDEFGDVTDSNGVQTTATFDATFAPDSANAGRYTTTLDITLQNVPAGDGTQDNLTVAAYQASGTQVFWIEEVEGEFTMGQFQQQNLPAAAAAAVKAAAKSPNKP
jgi:hypothetical protein